ncbi:macro domain-containing protein (plasmid) [Synechococcus elongatus PCC 11801]|uniref:Macro domain-containing protein n=1 Tax=Synechococcus elongatus PCC 11801 TaxID=2219813 RepID=A0ACD5A2J1_SYNEL
MNKIKNQWLLIVTEFFTKEHWLHTVFSRKTIDYFFSLLGKFWLAFNITSAVWPSIKSYTYNYYLIVGFIIVTFLYASRPHLSIVSNVKNCDMKIEIHIGDIFDFSGAYVIPTNTTFDVDISTGIISSQSLQGQFASRLYNNNFQDLDNDLECALNGINYKELSDNRIGKKKKYPIGTIAQIRKSDKVFYMVAIANLNSYGAIENAGFADIQDSLLELWNKVGSAGNIDPLVIPLIGSLRCRLKEPRIEFVKEIVNSYSKACVNKKLCEKLIIVISTEDYKKHEIDTNQLEEYLNCKCKFPEFSAI